MKGLLKKLIRKESGTFRSPEFVFDTNYESIKIRPPKDQKTSSLDLFELIRKKASLIRIDEEYVHKFKGFERLCRDNFLNLLRKIKFQKIANVKVKFLFLDFETSILFKRLITWLEIKDANISCIFILNEDQVSNDLTENANLFYIISINYLQSHQIQFCNELKNRKCLKFKIYLREQRNYLDKTQSKLIHKIEQLTKTEMNYLNIVLPINESIILLDNSIVTLQTLINLLKLNSSNLPKKIDPDKNLKYSNQLAYVLFKNNLNPSIRYLNNFNESNKLIAESTFKILQKYYDAENKIDSPDQNCVLLIIDRSLDFLTPLLHSKTYYEFVNQELEIVLTTDFKTLDETKFEDASLFDIAEKLIVISKNLTKEQTKIDETHRSLSELAFFDRKAALLGQHLVYANQIRDKLKNGYQHLVNIETYLLNETALKIDSNENEMKNELKDKSKKSKIDPKTKTSKLLATIINLDQKEFIEYLKKILGPQISQLDWKRILFLYSIMKGPLESNSIKTLKSILTKDVLKEIEQFVSLLKKIEMKNQSKFISLKSILKKIETNELDESKYPTVNCLINNPPTKQLIFMSGGISFNELNLVRTNKKTVLISDSILYPRRFLDALR